MWEFMTLLVILEPVVSLVFGGLALLGVLTVLFYNLIRLPHFPTWTMLSRFAESHDSGARQFVRRLRRCESKRMRGRRTLAISNVLSAQAGEASRTGVATRT